MRMNVDVSAWVTFFNMNHRHRDSQNVMGAEEGMTVSRK